jgi:hypothetical protein
MTLASTFPIQTLIQTFDPAEVSEALTMLREGKVQGADGRVTPHFLLGLTTYCERRSAVIKPIHRKHLPPWETANERAETLQTFELQLTSYRP